MGISGTAALLSRLTNLRNVVRNVGGPSGIAPIFGRNLSVVGRSYSVDINSVVDAEEIDVKPKKKFSKAMKAYLERARDYDESMKKEIAEFQIGKRHLANMMGVDLETFTQKDINESISYLFPSGLYEKKARPLMEPPEKIFPPRKEAQFDESGRPYHSLFYTCKPNFHQVLHDIVGNLYRLNDFEDKAMKDGIVPRPDDKINLLSSRWMTKDELELLLLESLRDHYYTQFIAAADRLADHPFAFRVKGFLMKFRTIITTQTTNASIPELEYTPAGRPYITVKDSKRKTAIANVTIYGKGTGKITINGKDISYFWDIQSREQGVSNSRTSAEVKMIILEERRRSAPILPPPRKRVQLERSLGMQTQTISTSGSRKYRPSASLLLARWLASRKSSMTDEFDSDGIWISDEHCMDYGKPPPVEEPYCFTMCMSESSNCEEGSAALQVNRDLLSGIVTEHMRSVGGRLQLLDDLETGKIDADNVEGTLSSCKPREINGMLLQASLLGRDDLLPGLIAAGADVNHVEEERGLTALHLCAYADSLVGVRYLVAHGARMNHGRVHTPFHYAAFGNSIAVARFFLEQDVSQESSGSEETVLHAATRSNSLDVLKLLAPNSPSLNRLDSCGYAVLHHAADRGDPACLAVLVEAGADVDLKTRKGDSALHLAAEFGCTECAEFLVEKGANVAARNHRSQTPLHLAARSHSLECVEILLRSGRCEANAEDSDGRTPLHLALGRSLLAYDVTEFLISWRADVNKADKYGYTPLHVAALNELSQCVDVLIHHGADLSARTRGGTTALSIILRKTPTSLSVFKRRLNASITLHPQSSAAGEMELRLDFHPLLQHRREGEIGYLGTFVKEGYKEILEHPLCQSFLHLKWQKIRKYYVGRLFFYLLYVLVLTAWVMTALAHNCYNESHGQVEGNGSLPLCANSTGVNGFFHRHPVVLEVEWYALVVLTVLEGLRKAAAILTYPSVRQFFTQPENVVEWCVILSVFATSFVYTGRTYTWQSHVGAFAVLCGWSNLMLMIGQLPMFGAYVAMFTSVQAQVFKLLLAYACLLVGFTASFCVIFPQSKSFSSPHTGLIKVLVMMTGELDFEELFFPGGEDVGRHMDVGSTSWILLQVSAQLSFVLFLLFVTIVLMNLLVGIAVHDIKGLQKTAGLAKLVRQTKLICDVESALLLALLPNKIMKIVRWTTLVLPSPLRAVLTVRPLNPRENRLPRDVLAAAHRVARDRRSNMGTASSKRSNSVAYTHRKSEAYTTGRRNDNETLDENYFGDKNDRTSMQNEIADLAKTCEETRKLIQDLVIALALDKRYNPNANEGEEKM